MTFPATSEAPASRPCLAGAEFQSGRDEQRRKLHVFSLFQYLSIFDMVDTRGGDIR